MQDIFSHLIQPAQSLADYKVHKLVLFPKAWKECKVPTKLHWKKIRFDSKNAPNVPADERGVYSFVVEPNVANHPACSYLMYVGKTERNFRKRYQEYLRDFSLASGSRRLHVAGMLNKWQGYLWFCYAPIKDSALITSTEDALLAGFIPPTNVELPGKLRDAIAWSFGT